MSDFPRNRHEMLRMLYRKTGDGLCKGCNAPIEWWKTNNKKSIPMNPIADDFAPATTHWETCPNAKHFKGVAGAPEKYSFEPEVRKLRERAKARVVVLVGEDGTCASWAGGIPAEDLRHDLISAANFVRAEALKGDTTL